MSLIFLSHYPKLEETENETKQVLKAVNNLVAKNLKEQEKAMIKTLSISLNDKKFGLKVGYDLNAETYWTEQPLDKTLMLIAEVKSLANALLRI